jgi:hypothetical protein
MKGRSKVGKNFTVTSQSILPKVTYSTVTVKRRKGNRPKSNVTVSQDDIMVPSGDWDPMPEVDNTWPMNLDPTEQQTSHVVHIKRRGGKVSVLLLAL